MSGFILIAAPANTALRFSDAYGNLRNKWRNQRTAGKFCKVSLYDGVRFGISDITLLQNAGAEENPYCGSGFLYSERSQAR